MEGFWEPATIMVLVLCAGVLALLLWFEVSWRRNEGSKERPSSLAQSVLDSLRKEDQGKAE